MSKQAPAADTSERDAAQIASRHCERCCGSGQVLVYDRRYAGRRIGESEVVVRGEIRPVQVGMVAAAQCVCEMGRWMRGRTEAEMLSRIPDLEAVLAGDSRWLAEDPRERARRLRDEAEAMAGDLAERSVVG